ncbi:MAG: ferrochelatase [Bacillales bacterium]|jgi:ferrochelatase|nr:ferrochelatase [Bacillales bacterium]
MGKKVLGLLVMAYGSPYSEDDLEKYYTHIRRGRKPSPELLQDLKERYEAIGGISPLSHITQDVVAKLEANLNKSQDEIEYKAYIGLKHIEPFIEDTVQEMKNDGIEEAIGVILAPHYSKYSYESYQGRAIKATETINGPKLHFVDFWYHHPQYINFWAEQISDILRKMPKDQHDNSVVIISAHSLPERAVIDDPYPKQLEHTAKLISDAINKSEVVVGWQSAGKTSDKWLGPDVQDLTRELYDEHKYKAFIYVPAGFVAEHLEVLYDNDIECKHVTDSLGASYYRPQMPNSSDEFINLLTTIVEDTKNTVNVKI